MLNSLNVALSGLAASKTQVENVMNNIANENTVGYKKRVVDVKESEQNDARLTGRGATVIDVNRITDMYMADNLAKQQSKSAEYTELSTMLSDIESIFSETDTSGFANNLDGYFQAIEDLRANPFNEIYRTNLINQGNMLVDGVQTLYARIEDRQNGSTNSAYDYIDEINGILNDIGNVNQKIQDSLNPSNDLLDKRDLLESRLAEYMQISVNRVDDSYSLEVGGLTAVRYNTNIHEISIVNDSIAQKDVYATDLNVSTLVESTWGNSFVSEKQTIGVGGTATNQVVFLGQAVAGSVTGDDAVTTVSKIIADKANIIATWNSANPSKEIDDITSTGVTLTIIYKDTEGDIPEMSSALSNGVTFGVSQENVKGSVDSITYYFDKDTTLSVIAGENITDEYGSFVVDKDSVVRALTYKINNDATMKNYVSAYNGQYSVDEDGNKIPKNPTTDDHYLILEAKTAGTAGAFQGSMLVNDNDVTDTDGNQISNLVKTNTIKSIEAQNDIHLEIFNQEVQAQSGKVKSILDNIDTTSADNKFEKYKTMLDDFAKALSDFSEAYIFQGEGEYISGEEASLLDKDKTSMRTIGLLNGTSVKTLSFNSSVVRNLTQEDLDYLSTIHWNENIKIGEDSSTSFSKYYQNIKITVSADKENIDYLKDTQESVTESLQTTYDKLVKVDKDEEMVNLIKFQAAYEANAKLITIVDEMLQTLLGMR